VTPIADPMNASSEFTRNRIRHELLPLMEEISPGSEAALVRYAQLASAEDSYLDTVADVALASLNDEQGLLRIGGLADLNIVLQRRIIRAWLHDALPVGVEVGQDRIDAVRLLARSGHGGARIQVGSGWQVDRAGRHLRLERESD
jgi:tRNA(Ile)-lysidine synthase